MRKRNFDVMGQSFITNCLRKNITQQKYNPHIFKVNKRNREIH